MQPGIPKHGPAGPQWRAASGHCRVSGCGMRETGHPPVRQAALNAGVAAAPSRSWGHY